jgi:hypothetical protein
MKQPFTRQHITGTLYLIAIILAFGALAKQSHAAGITQDLGIIKQGSTFQATHNYYPDPWFQDTYTLTILPNSGVGNAAIAARIPTSSGIKFTHGTINDGVKDWLLTTTNPAEGPTTIHGSFYGLSCITCIMTIEGRVISPDRASYTGNWQIIETNASAVPLPGAVWLFGFGITLIIGMSKSRENH